MSYFAKSTSKQSSLAQNRDSVTWKSICLANHILHTVNWVLEWPQVSHDN